jgi:ABC-type transport system substrate-binding protein
VRKQIIQEEVMIKNMKLWMAVISLVVAAAMLMAACQPAAAPVEEPAAEEPAAEAPAAEEGGIKRGGTLVIGRHEEPLTFDPFVPGDNGSIYLLVQVVETLTRADETGAGIEPGLAESWDVSEDNLEYTFYLRDAQFSNGSPVTAGDVEYSINIAATDSGYAFLFEPIDSMQVIDDKTIKFTLKRVYSPFFQRCLCLPDRSYLKPFMKLTLTVSEIIRLGQVRSW